MRFFVLASAPLLVASLVGCPRDTPPEPASYDSPRQPATSETTAAKTTAAAASAVATAPPAMPSTAAANDEPAPPTPPAPPRKPTGTNEDPFKGGNYTMADATKGLAGTGPLIAKIDTSKGLITCDLYDDKAPKTVASFVGLARGIRPFKDPVKSQWVTGPWFDATTFHRVIKGFMIQGGDPLGSGGGEPGFTVPDELWPGAKHDRAGLLCMANRGHDTNGGQFFITDDAAAHLDGNYTIFGTCTPVDTVHAIANVKVAGSKPRTTVYINSVKIERAKPK